MTINEISKGAVGPSSPGRSAQDDCASHLEQLSHQECILRLEARGIGRVGVVLENRPAIYPVNYIVDGESIVFRTRQGSALFAATWDSLAALEIDSTDALNHEGWSVLVVGRATHIVDLKEISRLEVVQLTPWAGNERDCFVRIDLDEVSGRRIHHRAPTACGAHHRTDGRAYQ